MSKTTLWPSCTGTIVRMEKRQGQKAEFVSLTLECTSKDGSTSFRRDAFAFDGEKDAIMTELLNAGIGTRIYARGPLKTATRTTESGASFRVSTMTIRQFKLKPAAVEDVTKSDIIAETAETVVDAPMAEVTAEDLKGLPETPALPEGASEMTHALYTRKDGTKAWRKKSAKQMAAEARRASEAAAAQAEPAVEVAQPVAEVAQPVATPLNAVEISGNTAMADALRTALDA